MITQADLQDRLTKLCQQFAVPGAAFAVARGDDTVVAWTGTANVRTGLPVVRDTLFAAGSVTKVFTVSLVMALVDEGLVELDAPVRQYVREIDDFVDTRARYLTVRMLLNHTSGLAGAVTEDLPRGPQCVAAFVEQLAQQQLNSPPGSYWSYTNGGLVLAGRVAEVVTGLSFNDALADRILRPLSLNATSETHEIVLRSAAVGHVPGPDGSMGVVPRFQLGTNAPAGSALACDIDALVAFARMHLHESQGVLSPSSVKAMQQKTIDLPWGMPYDSCGLGWIRRDTEAGLLITHTGANAGQHSSLIVLPEQQGVLAALTNSIGGAAVYSTLNDQLLQELFGVTPMAPVAPPVPTGEVEMDLASLLGVYVAHEGRVVVEERDGRLHISHEFDPDFIDTMQLIMGAGFPPPPSFLSPYAADGRFVSDPGGLPIHFITLPEEDKPSYVYVGRIMRRVS